MQKEIDNLGKDKGMGRYQTKQKDEQNDKLKLIIYWYFSLSQVHLQGLTQHYGELFLVSVSIGDISLLRPCTFNSAISQPKCHFSQTP